MKQKQQKNVKLNVKSQWSNVINWGLGKERDYIVENIGMLTNAGMNISDAINSLIPEIKSSRIKKIIVWMHEEIEAGATLWRVMEQSGLFPDHAISLIKLGEETGKLPENLKLVAAEQDKEREFRSKIKSAMMYPIFVLGLTGVIGICIAWFILPKLATVFSQLHLKLPTVTKILINTGLFLDKYGTIAIPSLIITIILFIYFLFIFSKTKFIGQYIILHLPGLNRIIKESELSRLGYLLGTMLQAGLPLIQAIGALETATNTIVYQKFYAFLKTNIELGRAFHVCFSEYKSSVKLIPRPIQQMIIAGEKSGNLAPTFLKIHELYESKTEMTTKNLTTILEPLLLVIVWLGVVAVALAVILPIYNLIGGLNVNPS